MTLFITRKSGFTLIEMLMVILILSIVSVITVSTLETSVTSSRFELTVEEMNKIRNAMVGDPTVKTDGVRSQYGFLGDIGAIPTAAQGIASLTAQPTPALPVWATNNANRIALGWNGPYLSGGDSGTAFTTDEWGTAYLYCPANVPPILRSCGPNLTCGGGGVCAGAADADDITVQLPTKLTTATVYGVILQSGALWSGDAQVELNYPNGAGVLTQALTTVVAASNGTFSFNNVPLGVRSATAYFPTKAAPTTTIGPVVFNVDANQYLIPTDLFDQGGGAANCTTPSVGFEYNSSMGLESKTSVNFRILLTEVCTNDVNVTYTTSDVTATAGSDYTAASAAATISAGNSFTDVAVTVANDTTVEPDESFQISLSNPTHPTVAVTLDTIVHTYTIVDNDGVGDDFYYVRTVGNDGNTGLSPAAAWLTIGKAASTLTAGDSVFVGGGTYAEASPTVSNSGTAGNLIQFIADRSGNMTGDSGAVIISATGNEGLVISGRSYLLIDGFQIIGAKKEGLKAASAASNVIIRNSIFDANKDGATFTSVSNLTIENSIFRNQTAGGISFEGAVGGYTISNNLIHNNSKSGIKIKDSTSAMIKGNTIYTNAESGFFADKNSTSTLYNNIITDNPIGIYNKSAKATSVTADYNDVWNNTTNYDNVAPGGNSLSIDPQYVNAVGGDFRITAGNGTESAGNSNASAVIFSDGATLSSRATRSDHVLDGDTANGDAATVNMGYHY